MSYDITLNDRVTGETLEVENPHFITGGTYAICGTNELWLNITYNYSHYYREATDGDPRFAHDEITAYYSDGTTGPVETKYGIRGIYGKSGAESIPMLKDMISRIEKKYKDDNGEWINTTRKKCAYFNVDGEEIDFYKVIVGIESNTPYTEKEYEIEVNEGPNDDYWEATAANAIRPLYQLIAFAEMRPDGVWDGD